MIKIDIAVDKATAEVNVCMPYVALLKMFHVITERIQPEDLTDNDSLGEIVLAEFIRSLFQVNNALMYESNRCETEQAIIEAENIMNLKGENS